MDDPHPVAAPTLTLIGRSSAWGTRLSVVPHPRRWSADQLAPPDPDRVVMTWLHHRTYGTIGVYLVKAMPVAAAVAATAATAATMAAHWHSQRLPPPRTWLQVRGHVQPWRVAALPDDPRSASDPALAPLALAVTDVIVIDRSRTEQPEHPASSASAPMLHRAQSVRLHSGRPCGSGVIAPLAQQPDFSFWQQPGGIPAPIVTWNRMYGVITTLGATRYLRYLLTATHIRQVTPG